MPIVQGANGFDAVAHIIQVDPTVVGYPALVGALAYSFSTNQLYAKIGGTNTDWTPVVTGEGGGTSDGVTLEGDGSSGDPFAVVNPDVWYDTQRAAMKALVPQLTRFRDIPIAMKGNGSIDSTVALDGGVEGGGLGVASNSVWLRFTETVFQTPKTGKWAIAFQAKFPAITVSSAAYFGLVNAGSTHLVAMGAVQSIDATHYVLQVTGAATTAPPTSLVANTNVHDCVLAFDGTTITLQVDGVTIGTTTTLTNLNDEGMSIASFSSAALTPGVVVSRACYGFI